MKTISKLSFIALAIFIISCKSEPKGSINSKELVGKYQIDFMPLLNSANIDSIGNEMKDVPPAFLKFILKNLVINVVFQENEKGSIQMDEKLLNMMKNFSSTDFENLNQFDYKIVKDTVLLIKGVEDTEYFEKATLSKMGSTYDSLRFSIIDDEESLSLVLRKVNS